MQISINDQVITISKGQHLQAVLKLRGLDHRAGIAVALNEQVIPKDNWSRTELNENDKLLIISATQGG